MKICERCQEEYSPNPNAVTTQKYCSRKCKEAQFYMRQKAQGKPRKRKGGYNRTVYVTKFLEARASDNTAPCTFCKKRLSADSSEWVLDHKVPLADLTSDYQNPDNLCICCVECNKQKSNLYSFDEFLALKQNA
mgnify:FL=1|jgi:5-methylcytosine-specific restriction endonuclease McrA